MRLSLPVCASLLLVACAPSAETADASPPAAAADYSTAITDPLRPAADREADAARKPAELLAFTQVQPGDTVGDYLMGGGYVTRLLARAVGPEGKVYGFLPDEFIAARLESGEAQEALAAEYPNVVAVRGPLASPDFPEPLDMIITVQNLHDLYTDRQPAGTAAQVIAALYNALKPGGTLVVVDHAAAAGTGTSAAGTLHRMERQAALDALEEAGFVLDGEGDLYANPDDPHTAAVFDPSIRGHTDQFALRLRKPG